MHLRVHLTLYVKVFCYVTNWADYEQDKSESVIVGFL